MTLHPHVVLTASRRNIASGGLAVAVGGIGRALVRTGCKVTLLVGEAPHRDALGAPLDIRVPTGDGFLGWSRRLASIPADILHSNGLWEVPHVATAVSSRRRGIPFVVSTHGMLEGWALLHRAAKKRLAWYLYQKALLQSAALIHATTVTEAESVRRLSIGTPIAVIPNGVDLPIDLPPRNRCEKRRALFLSRLHPVKGLPLLIEAWARARPSGWEFVVAGPDEDGHRAYLEALVRRAGLSDTVTFAGPVAESDKWAVYRTADLFVLPTHSENFGLVVAESLGAGVPVLTTKGAPWRELETHRCGWWTDVSVDAIAVALADATRTSRADLDAMGERGRALVLDRYGWDDAAGQMKAVYEWILGTGDRPSCVHLD